MRDMHSNGLLLQFSIRNVQKRFRGSLLGGVWAFLYPLLMLGTYTFIFGCLFKCRWGNDVGQDITAYAIMLFSGIALYNMFSESVSICSAVIPANLNYVKKVKFPLLILPESQVFSCFFLGLVWIFILLLSVLLFFHCATWSWLLLPFTLLPLLLFTAGVSFFIASLGVYIRDIQYLIGVILQIFFFLSPIFYRVDNLPEIYRPWLRFNPMLWLIELNRSVIFYHASSDYTSLPPATAWIVCYCLGVVSLILGCAWFWKTQKGFGDVL